jgi:hypothetical protein
MISSSIYVRIVAADKNRGYIILVGYDAKIVQRTAIQQVSLSVLSKANIQTAFGRIKANYRASELRDVTADGIKKRIEKEIQASGL